MADKRKKKPEIYAFPAVFTIDHEDNDAVLVSFPDMENCFADGETPGEALKEAREALGNVLYWMEKEGHDIPVPSRIQDIKADGDGFVSLVEADMAEVRREWDSHSVTRTVTLPAWLDSKAKAKSINFSQTLQQSLLRILGIDNETTAA